MAYAAIAMAVVSAVSSYENAQGSIQQAHADQAAGYRTAAANEDRVRAGNAQKLGSQRAAAVQSGFDPNSGSIAQLQQQSAGNAELDALTTRYQGRLNAWRDEQEVNGARAQMKTGFVKAGVSAVAGAYGGDTMDSYKFLTQGSAYW
jgi:hypothetical protein